MDPIFTIVEAIKQKNVIKAMQSYSQMMQRIINSILIVNQNNVSSQIISDIINRETNCHSIIINTFSYLLRKSVYSDNHKIITSSKLLVNISNSYTVHDFLELTKTPSLYLPPNFDTFLSRVLSVSLNDVQVISAEPLNESNFYNYVTRNGEKFSTLGVIYGNIINGYVNINNNYYNSNSIWFQQLQLVSSLYRYIHTFMKITRDHNVNPNPSACLVENNRLLTDIATRNDTIRSLEIDINEMNQKYEDYVQVTENQLKMHKLRQNVNDSSEATRENKSDKENDRETERERERETERQRERQRETERETERQRERQRETERDTERQRERQRETEREREREREKDERTTRDEKIKSLQKIVQTLEETKNSEQQEKINLDERIEKLKEDVDAIKTERDALKKLNAEIHKENDRVQKQMGENTKKENVEEIKRENARLRTLTRSLEERAGEIKYEEELQRVRETSGSHLRENQRLQTEIAKLVEQNNQLMEKDIEMTDDTGDAVGMNVDVSVKPKFNPKKNNKNKHLMKRPPHAFSENAQLKIEIANLKSQIRHMEDVKAEGGELKKCREDMINHENLYARNLMQQNREIESKNNQLQKLHSKINTLMGNKGRGRKNKLKRDTMKRENIKRETVEKYPESKIKSKRERKIKMKPKPELKIKSKYIALIKLTKLNTTLRKENVDLKDKIFEIEVEKNTLANTLAELDNRISSKEESLNEMIQRIESLKKWYQDRHAHLSQ